MRSLPDQLRFIQKLLSSQNSLLLSSNSYEGICRVSSVFFEKAFEVESFEKIESYINDCISKLLKFLKDVKSLKSLK